MADFGEEEYDYLFKLVIVGTFLILFKSHSILLIR